MAETKQISATFPNEVYEWVLKEAEAQERSFSEMLVILIKELKRLKSKKKGANVG